MLWPFHLRCKTMDFLDIQEMLMVISNVSFKLNYISSIMYTEWIRVSSDSDVGLNGLIVISVLPRPGISWPDLEF